MKRNWDLPEGATSAFEADLTQEQVLKFKEYVEQHENEKQGKPRAGERVADAYAGDPSPTRSERMAQEAANAANSDSGGEWVRGDESPGSGADAAARQPEQRTPGRMLLESDSDSEESARGRPAAPPAQPPGRRFSLD
ncbi:hypothetical protein [Streptomyces sp. TLI_146]|uniref:hypothetical protein n=1 Tax=Streptomyces sp. TLI_146 TaxID=1938858 RepID=UPI000C71134E|nr:hypothetical protein [Streptomyces sp. TLI_146]